MKLYDFLYHPKTPDGIESRKAYIVGGGIAGLAAAAFLVDDAKMPGKNITIYEKRKDVGGCCGVISNEGEYVCPGERELEAYMECLWYLCSKIPSLDDPSRTVLDETVDVNRELPIHSECRAIQNQGHIWEGIHDYRMDEKTTEKLQKFITEPESDLENITIEDYLGKDSPFFDSAMWWCFHPMLAFQSYHSLIEMQRYATRFMHQLHLIRSLRGILRTKYDQYHSLIMPLQKYLVDAGVNFVADTTVTDMDFRFDGNKKTVTALEVKKNGNIEKITLSDNDFVYFTNGSMTQNSTRGSMTEAPKMNTDTENRGCFTLWEKIAKKADGFGHPEKFVSSPEKSNFVSVTLTVKDYPQFFEYLEKKTGNPTGKGGATTFVSSPWFITYGAALQPLEPNQPENVQVLWFYGLHSNEKGEYVKKPMNECTGEETLKEFLYWCGLEDKFEEIKAHCIAIPTVMPYITSQFMPRTCSDRPEVIPAGSTNLAFIG